MKEFIVKENMARPLRIQYCGAWYEGMSRGRRGEKIFCGKKDYEAFIELLISRRGYFNEPRNVAIYVIRHIRGDKLKEVGGLFGISKNSTISSIDRRLKGEMKSNKRLKKAIEKIGLTLSRGQE
jgi:hypothetical protein